MRAAAVLAAICCLIPVSGCADEGPSTRPAESSSPEPSSSEPATPQSASGTTTTTDTAALPQSDEPVDLDPAAFTPEVTNPWFPLAPGTRWTYRETTEDDETVRVVITATSVTHAIANGITARVVRDTVTLDGDIIEDTFDWYAQDADGTVWYLGEDTAEFEDGKLSTREGSFEAGVDGAQAGVIMPASPAVGLSYRQEYYQGEAEDHGEVLALGEQAEVPAGSYDGLLKTADTTPLEPDVLEHKYYAEEVGLVLTIDREGGGREELLGVTRVPAAEARRAGVAPLGTSY